MHNKGKVKGSPMPLPVWAALLPVLGRLGNLAEPPQVHKEKDIVSENKFNARYNRPSDMIVSVETKSMPMPPHAEKTKSGKSKSRRWS